MPKQGHYDNTYPDKLRTIGISLLEDFKGAKKHHLMECDICYYEFSATPISKLQNYKKHKMVGCPRCTNKLKYEIAREQNIQFILNKGFEILSDWDGRRYDNKTDHTFVKVKNTKCDHTFTSRAINLLTRDVNCPICNKEEKIKTLNASTKQRSEQWQETATEWQQYRNTVHNLTRITYTEHHQVINPTQLPRGKAGEDGAYHLDHIVPVRWCFEHKVPEEICAHNTNLQMLGWRENVGSRDKLKEGIDVPLILKHYVIQP